MDFPSDVDSVIMELSILNFNGSQVEISNPWCNSGVENCFYLAAFHLGLRCLLRHLFAGIQNVNGLSTLQFLFIQWYLLRT